MSFADIVERVAPYSAYQNTIPLEHQGVYPGDLALEERITSIMRWNALAMVARANAAHGELGGHIASYASAAEIFETGFHHHFRSVTAMTPLQYQKQLRLQEARRLMVGKGFDAASAGYRVGYGDASHFTREYKRLFGATPMRDVERLRETATESTD